MKENNLEFSFTSYEIINNKIKKLVLEAKENLSFKQLEIHVKLVYLLLIKKKVFDNEKFKFGKTKTKEDLYYG